MSQPTILQAVEAEAVPTVAEAFAAVMAEVGSVAKTGRNTVQNYSFRGVDAVVNAVGPVLRKHGVFVLPVGEECVSEHFLTKKEAQMRSVTLRVRWRVYGPAGDYLEAVTYGESADSGDKAVPKAHSVAYRTFWLQALCIPTDEPDPDSQSYERAPAAEPTPSAGVLRARIARAGKDKGQTPEEIAADFRTWSTGADIASAEPGILAEYLTSLT